MNYRHHFHAGNFADMLKHGLVLSLLARLIGDRRPLLVLDTHAGAGLYDLEGPEAQKSKEAAAGVGRLMSEAEVPAAFDPLKAAVQRANPKGGYRFYPGSPRLMVEALRPGDRYVGCELRPDDQATLAADLRAFAGAAGPQAEVRCADGYATAASLKLKPGERLFALIDPPFERPDDYANAQEAAAALLARQPDALIVIWIPIKDLETYDAFLRRLAARVDRPLLSAEVRLRPLVDPMKLNGCAVVMLGVEENAPEGPAELEAICRWTAGTSPGARGRIIRA